MMASRKSQGMGRCERGEGCAPHFSGIRAEVRTEPTLAQNVGPIQNDVSSGPSNESRSVLFAKSQ